MGVRYILEGSVQSSGDRVRVTAQLIDAITGRHMWADHYERELKDSFAIQDEITHKVVTEIGVRLGEGEMDRLRQATLNIEAYKLLMKAVAELRKFTSEGLLKARELLEKAIEIDPQYSLGYSVIAWTHALEVQMGYSKNPAQSFNEIDQYINKALELDPDNWDVPPLLTYVYFLKGQYDESIVQGRRAVERSPNLSDSHAFLALSLVMTGQSAEAITEITKAMRLAPSYPTWFLNCLGTSYFVAGRYEEAIVVHKKLLEREPPGTDSYGWISSYVWLAVINSAMGRENQARIEAKKLLKNLPSFSLKQWGSMLRFQDEALNDRIIHYASKAGLPE